MIEKARAAIEAEKKAAVAELQGSIADISVSVASRLVGEDLGDDDHRQILFVRSSWVNLPVLTKAIKTGLFHSIPSIPHDIVIEFVRIPSEVVRATPLRSSSSICA